MPPTPTGRHVQVDVPGPVQGGRDGRTVPEVLELGLGEGHEGRQDFLQVFTTHGTGTIAHPERMSPDPFSPRFSTAPLAVGSPDRVDPPTSAFALLRRALPGVLGLALIAPACLPPAAAAPRPRAQVHRLQNGLTVILEEDHALPLVAVSLFYRVGSAHEPPGRSGFAHLFEHLMFTGTERVPDGGFDELLEQGGAWSNASTAEDYTEYHQVGPAHLLPTMLWLDADRMETLGRAVTQEKLDVQTGRGAKRAIARGTTMRRTVPPRSCSTSGSSPRDTRITST